MKRTLPPGVATFSVATVVLAVAAVLVIRAWDSARIEWSLRALSLVSSLRSTSAVEELEQARSDAILWSGFGGVAERLVELEEAWDAMGPDAAERLARLFVRENPYPKAERFLLADPGDGSLYSRVHAVFHPRIRGFLAIHEYRDILLVNPSGRVVYTFDKEDEFATDLLRGPWRETHLGEVARAVPSLEHGATVLSDFRPHEPSGGEWALFIASPVAVAGADGDQGALVFQIAPGRIGKQMVRSSQQRGSSSSMILGDGYRVVGQPPWLEEADAADPVEGEARRRAPQEGAGSGIIRTREGSQVLAAWEPISFEGIQWIVVTWTGMAEVRAEGADERRTVVVITLLVWLAAGVLTLGRIRPSAMGRHRI